VARRAPWAEEKEDVEMTAAEQGQLFVEFLSAANTVFANYMTLVFAMLTASWFLAKRMSRVIVGLFLFLYTFAAIAIGSGVVGAFGDFFALQRYLLEVSPPDGPLQWLGPVREGFSPPATFMARVIEAVVWLPWLGSIVFFFALRREKPEATKVE
jgi:hypothetical protein